jgi:hypothetical protein
VKPDQSRSLGPSAVPVERAADAGRAMITGGSNWHGSGALSMADVYVSVLAGN